MRMTSLLDLVIYTFSLTAFGCSITLCQPRREGPGGGLALLGGAACCVFVLCCLVCVREP